MKKAIIMTIMLIMLTNIAIATRPFDKGWERQINRSQTRDCVYDIILYDGKGNHMHVAQRYWTENLKESITREVNGYITKGIRGRMSDGRYECIIPGKRQQKQETNIATTIDSGIEKKTCEIETTCKTKCGKKTCTTKNICK